MTARRAAALVAESLNRAELERGGDEPEDADDAEDYVLDEAGSDHEAVNDGTREPAKAALGTSSMSRKRAEEVWLAMNAMETARPREAIMSHLHAAAKAPRVKKLRAMDPMLAAALKAPCASGDAADASGDARKVAQDALLETSTTRVETQVKYGGQMVNISREIQTKQAMLDSARAAKQSGLDRLVVGLQARKGISTVTKSSADWDTYKHEHKLQDELADAPQKGFVEKTDFLSRVDDRQFEIERAQRERERVQREASQASRKI